MEYTSRGLECYLDPKDECPYTDKERVINLEPNIILLLDSYGSHRFIYYYAGQAISVIQFLATPRVATMANIFTKEEFRRKGYCRTLYNCSKEYFSANNKPIQISPYRSPLGRLFISKVCS